MLLDFPGGLCVRNLTGSGAVIVSAMRTAPAGSAATMTCFVEALGEEKGRPCYVVFLQIVHTLALYGRRRMRVGAENWPLLTHDEVAFARCVDGCFSGDEGELDARIAWLVRPPGMTDLAGYVATLSSLMGEPMLRQPGRAEPRNRGTVASRRRGRRAPVPLPESAISSSAPKG
ncbi:MAG: hypothetical protein AAF942_00980 [Pseudomonadota bacterium]